MVLTQPLVGLGLLLLALAVVAVALTVRLRRRRADAGLRVAHTGRIRRLPRYQQLARRGWHRSLLAMTGVLATVAAAAWLAARPVDTSVAADEQHNRDVVLCLDVSGSMAEVDQATLAAFADLASRLRGERIGLVLFDATAVTLFPLTDDAGYIRDQLQAASQEIGAGPVTGTRLGELGSSLIGDGLATCLDQFDERDASRGRTVVLATDNQVAGKPVFTVAQAAALARERDVLVFGLVPADNSVAATDDLAERLEPTGGKVLLLGAEDAPETITTAVARQERAALAGQPRGDARDAVAPGVVVALAGLLLTAWAQRGRRP